MTDEWDFLDTELIIDPEFKALIPPLTKDEYELLEQSIKTEGCREPILCWDGIIVDGHNRYEICTKYGIKFETKQKEFATRDDVKLWMIGNQLARRNINNYARTTLVAMSDDILKARKKAQEVQTSGLKQNVLRVCEFTNTEKPKFEPKIDPSMFDLEDEEPENQSVTTQKPKTNITAEIAKQAGVGEQTVSRTIQINKAIDEAVKNDTTVAGQKPEELKEQLMSGEVSINEAYRKIKLEKKKKEIVEAEKKVHEEASDEFKPVLYVGDSIGHSPDEKYDLLLTDPPYSTDVDNIEEFVDSWLYNALEYVKPTGFAYVFIGAYPKEVKTYLNAKIPEHMTLCQQLIWTYKNTLGNNPRDRYKQNYQVCLFYRGIEAPNLNIDLTNEQWAVQEINAPDGRQGDRYHMWQKPMKIAERFVRHSTQKGMTVFDPFACTGTFLLAATKLGRKAYGFEINPDNAAIAYERGCVRK